MQQARNLAFTLDERFEDIKFLIRDRGSNFTPSFDAVFQATGTRILRADSQFHNAGMIASRRSGACSSVTTGMTPSIKQAVLSIPNESWQQISYPYLDSETPVLDAVIQRAKVAGVRAVLVAGEVIYQDGRFTRVDRDAAMGQLSEMLQRDLTAEEQERRHLAKAILPHVKAFYDGYWNAASHQPFYSQSSRT